MFSANSKFYVLSSRLPPLLPQHHSLKKKYRWQISYIGHIIYNICILLDQVLPLDAVESQFDNYLLSCKYLKSRVFRGAIVVMSSSQWLFATWISMFPQLRTEREIFCCKKLFPVLLSSAATDQLAGGYYGPELGWFLLT